MTYSVFFFLFFLVMVQWKQELRTVDERVRTVVGVKDQARTQKNQNKTWLSNNRKRVGLSARRQRLHMSVSPHSPAVVGQQVVSCSAAFRVLAPS